MAPKRKASPKAQNGTNQRKLRTRAKPRPQEEVNYEDLDLDVSYVGKIKIPPLPVRPKKKRWTHDGDEPIVSLKDVPPGWSDKEPDLDPEDLDAYIARCKERIDEDKIMPRIFERRLEWLEKEKESRVALMKEYPGLDFLVIQRIKQLDEIAKWLTETKNPYEFLTIVKNVKQEYMNGTLQMNPGLVTYWSKGKRICEPRPYSDAEFTAISGEHDGSKAFWVEGDSAPVYTGMYQQPKFTLNHFHVASSKNKLAITVRMPGQPPEFQQGRDFDFVDDTGSEFMTLYYSDVKLLNDHLTDNDIIVPWPPLQGVVQIITFSGKMEHHYVHQMEVAFHDLWGEEVVGWEAIPVIIVDDRETRSPKHWLAHRVNGPWIRRKLHVASAPDCSGDTHLFRNLTALREGTPVGLPVEDREYNIGRTAHIKNPALFPNTPLLRHITLPPTLF